MSRFRPWLVCWVLLVATLGCGVHRLPEEDNALRHTGLPGPCNLRGTVRASEGEDPGRPLVGAMVILSSEDLSGIRTTVTDENGYYYFSALPPSDNYQLKVESPGWATDISQFRLLPFYTLTCDVFLDTWGDHLVLRQPPEIDYSSTSH